MARKVYPSPSRRRAWDSTSATCVWRLDESALPCANYGSSTLTVSNTGSGGSVAFGYRSPIRYGISTTIGTGTTRNCIYTGNPGANDIVTGSSISFGVWLFLRDTATGSQTPFAKLYNSDLTTWAAPFNTFALDITTTTFPRASITTGTAGAGTRTVIAGPQQLAPYHAYLLAGTYNGSTLKLYVNGGLAGSVACTGNIDNSTFNSNHGGPYCFGTYASTNAALNGIGSNAVMSDAFVTSTVLDESTLIGMYMVGLGTSVRDALNMLL